MRFKVQPRLRSFARLITQNYKLRILFQGERAAISGNTMFIPPVENTTDAFKRAMYDVAHECGHAIFSDFGAMKDAHEDDRRLPRILNCLEDARTERLMIRRFEGLEPVMAEEIRRIMEGWDVLSIPLSQQILYGLFLTGRRFEMPFSDDAKRILAELEPLIRDAADAPDSNAVLGIARQVLEKLDAVIDDLPEAEPLRGADFSDADMSDAIAEHLAEVRIDDDMNDYPQLRDENCPEEETIRDVDEGNLGEYLAELNPLRAEMNYLIQHMQKIVDTKRARKRSSSFRKGTRGAVDTRRLWKVATGQDDILKHRCVSVNRGFDVDPDSLAIYILLDESHSMQEGQRFHYARQAAMIVCEALSELCIRFALTGYTASQTLARYPYKDFGENWANVRTRLLHMTHRMGTYTAEHIPFALRHLRERSERKKLLIVITDATDIESLYRLKEAILDVKDEGVEIVGIGIQTDLMSQWYDRYIEVTHLSGFARTLLELLRETLKR